MSDTFTQAPYYKDASWTFIPEHMRGAVERYVMHGISPGNFLRALFANDFMQAAGRADADNLRALSEWARFIYNDVPSGCHGSYERVAEWCSVGGLVGQRGEQ